MMETKYRIYLIYIVLAIITFAVYEPILHNSFVSFDDDSYIYDNPHITSGLNINNIVWAFTNIHSNNYHPLTSISHMLDCQLYKLHPGGHHLTNLVFHLANTALLFFVLSSMTKRIWASAFVAALFALHPMHVESVAWASERKDVLSAFFWLLTMLAYWHYVQNKSKRYYVLTLITFTLGLLSKPMLVTLPCVLLLLDYWPLQRLKNVKLKLLIAEKIPFFALSGILSIVTFLVQRQMGIVKDMMRYPFTWRLENAIASYVIYIEKMFWPFNLAIFYPHPKGTISPAHTVTAILILAVVTIFALQKIRSKPYLAIGWLWFMGTLVPVIGLFQVGMQSHADRYTYIPYIGLFIAITWLVCDVPAKINSRKLFYGVFAGLLLFSLGIKTYIQNMFWQNNYTLYSHAIDVVDKNWWAYGFLGVAMGKQGEYDVAEDMLKKSLEISPDNASMYYELAKISLYKGDWKLAIKMYEKLLPPLPDDVNDERNVNVSRFDYPMLRNMYINANINMAIALTNEGRYAESQRRYKEALWLVPDLQAAKDGLKRIEELMRKSSETKDANAN
ncbi:MAG: tetratricopeptide repeat protein [Planctomycetaceae bacterium]|nr:tetratricopeptide repeat protein [Planctomycetaceae bacterium]